MAIITQYAAADDSGSPVEFPDADILQVRPGEWDSPLQEWAFPGVIGTEHITDNRKGRDLRVRIRLKERASRILLLTDLEALRGAINTLLGSVTIPGNGSYYGCTYRGFKLDDRGQTGDGIEFDGKQTNGWMAHGWLLWRQRGPTPGSS